MGTLVKLIRSCVLVGAAAALASCGGGDGGGEPEHAPSISNLRYSPSGSIQSAGSTASVEVLVDFADSGGDVVAARMSISSGADLTVVLSTLSGVKNGTSTATFRVPLDTVGKYAFDAWLTDDQGAASNHLTGSFEVVAPDATVHPPSISNLRSSPATAVQAVGGATSVIASADFADVGADVVSLRMTTSAGADLTIPLSNLDGIKIGTATGAFIVASDTVGKYTFEVWLVDGRGAASNHLSGGFEVLAPTPARDPPTISNLRYSPANAVQAAGGTAAISVSVDFSDAGANVVSARFMSSAGPDITVPVASGGGLKSGTATATFVVSTATLGAFAFQVWLIDSKGDSSNNISGSFEIVPIGGTGTWSKVPVSPPAELLGIGWNGYLYVAVGRAGTVMTSSDLALWSAQSSGVNHTLRSVAASASKFVAVGDSDSGESVVLASTDGRDWVNTYRSSDCGATACPVASQLSKVIWTGTQFVAVGLERPSSAKMLYALILTSPDGVAWTQRASQEIAITDEWYAYIPRWVTSIAWSGTRFVLTAVDVNWEPVAWISADAQAWTVSHDIPTGAVWMAPFFDVTWASGRFVAIDATGSHGGAPTFVSLDGVHWDVDGNTADLPQMNAVTGRDGEFLAVGDTYRQISPDGLTWTVSSHLAGCGKGVLWDGSRYVSVGASICKSQ